MPFHEPAYYTYGVQVLSNRPDAGLQLRGSVPADVSGVEEAEERRQGKASRWSHSMYGTRYAIRHTRTVFFGCRFGY